MPELTRITIHDDVRERLAKANERRARRTKAAVRAAVGPSLRKLARAYLPEEPARAKELAAEISALSLVAAKAALESTPSLGDLPHGTAIVLDGRGGREVVELPAAPSLDVSKILLAAKAVEREALAAGARLPRALAFAIVDLTAAIGGGT